MVMGQDGASAYERAAGLCCLFIGNREGVSVDDYLRCFWILIVNNTISKDNELSGGSPSMRQWALIRMERAA